MLSCLVAFSQKTAIVGMHGTLPWIEELTADLAKSGIFQARNAVMFQEWQNTEPTSEAVGMVGQITLILMQNLHAERNTWQFSYRCPQSADGEHLSSALFCCRPQVFLPLAQRHHIHHRPRPPHNQSHCTFLQNKLWTLDSFPYPCLPVTDLSPMLKPSPAIFLHIIKTGSADTSKLRSVVSLRTGEVWEQVKRGCPCHTGGRNKIQEESVHVINVQVHRTIVLFCHWQGVFSLKQQRGAGSRTYKCPFTKNWVSFIKSSAKEQLP